MSLPSHSSEVDGVTVIARAEQAIANVKANPDGWNIAALEGITRELIAQVERLSATPTGAVDLLRKLAQMPLTATGKDFDPLVKAARDLLPEYTAAGGQ